MMGGSPAVTTSRDGVLEFKVVKERKGKEI